MGLTQSLEQKEHQTFMSNYIFEKTIHHEHYGKVDQYYSKLDKNQKILEKIKKIKPDSKYNISIENINLKSKIEITHVCKILKHSIFKTSDCFSETFEHRIVVEHFEDNFAKKIENFTKNKIGAKYMDESSAWQVLYDLISVASFYHRYNQFMIEVSPLNVLITPNGDIRFLDLHYLTFVNDLIDRMEEFHPYKCAFSPESVKKKMSSLKNIDVEAKTDHGKSDIFMIAVTVLCIILNKELEYFYDYATLEIKFEKMQKKMVKLIGEGYSEDFIDILVGMLNVDPGQRTSLKELVVSIKRLINPFRKRTYTVLI